MGFASTAPAKVGAKPKPQKPARRRIARRTPKGMHPEIFKRELRASVAAHTGRRMQLYFHGTLAFTDGKSIVLPDLPNDTLIEHRIAMVFRGYVRHERQHVMMSDFDMLKEFLDRFGDNKMLRYIAKRTHNALEDVRIEQNEVSAYAGAMTELNIMAEHINGISAGNIAEQPDYLAIAAFVAPVALTWAGRLRLGYPTTSNEDCLNLLPPDTRTRVETWADRMMVLQNNADTFDLAQEIAEELFQELPPELQSKDPEPDSQGQSQQGQPQPGQGNGQGDQSDQGQNQNQQGQNQQGQPQQGQPQQGQNQQGQNQQGQPQQGQGQQGQPQQGQSQAGQAQAGTTDPNAPTAGDPANADPANQGSSPAQSGSDPATQDNQGQPASSDPKAANQPSAPLPVEPSLKEIYRKLGIDIEEAGDGIPYVDAKDKGKEAKNDQGEELGKGMSGFATADINYVNIHAPSTRHAAHRFTLPRLPLSNSKLYDWRVTTESDASRALSSGDGFADYQAIKASITGPMAAAARVLRRRLTALTQSRWRGGFEEGDVDLRRLSRVASGNIDIFRQKTIAPKLDTAVGILIDNSGSMAPRIRLCQEMGCLLIEAFRGTPIKFEMAGFTNTFKEDGDGNGTVRGLRKMGAQGGVSGLELYLFKGYDDPPGAAETPIGNMTRVDLGGTPTPEAIRAFYPRLYVRPEKRKVLVVITDGLDDHEEVRRANELLTKLGVDVIGVGIEEDGVRQSFDRSVVIRKIDDLSGTVLNELADVLIPQKRR